MPLSAEAGVYDALNRRVESDYKKLAHLRDKFETWTAAARQEKLGADDLEKNRSELEKHAISLLLAEEPGFPPLLLEIPQAPFGIYLMGRMNSDRPHVAVVGTRKATESGRELAYEFSKFLAARGVVIVSGLALGVDGAAHEGALAGGGTTIAVLANGLPNTYPRHHTDLAKKIIAQDGALISEYPPGTPSLPYRFLERNRIVSGLSLGILLIEAPEQSGSLATARFALEQNRDVFVLPGPPRHPNYRGSHRLIKEGANLVTEPEEILESLNLAGSLQSMSGSPAYSREEQIIIDTLLKAGRPLYIDKITELTNLETHVVLQTLSFLIIRNSVREDGEGYMVC